MILRNFQFVKNGGDNNHRFLVLFVLECEFRVEKIHETREGPWGRLSLDGLLGDGLLGDGLGGLGLLLSLGLGLLGLLGGGLGDKDGVDVGEDTALGDGDTAKELVELLVVADGELDVAGDDAGLLVVAGGVSGELEDLSGQVLEDGSEVHGGTSSDAGSVLALLEVAAHTSDGELETSLLCQGEEEVGIVWRERESGEREEGEDCECERLCLVAD